MANADNATLREILSVLPLTRVSNVTGYNGALLPQGCSISASATVTLTQNQWNFMSFYAPLQQVNRLNVEITTGQVGAVIRTGLWERDAVTGGPGRYIGPIGADIDASTAALVTQSFTNTFSCPPRPFFVGLICDAASVAIRGFAAPSQISGATVAPTNALNASVAAYVQTVAGISVVPNPVVSSARAAARGVSLFLV